MKSQSKSARREFLVRAAAIAPVVVLAATTSACQGTPANHRVLTFTSLSAAMEELGRLAKPEALAPAAAFSWAQTLVHCAQSIEFSMTGFPEPKSALFQKTAGAAAFKVFSMRGRMSHDLADPIPGAPPLDANTEVAAALARLHQSVAAFQQWKEPLKPHFAYGELSKAEFDQAHAMHLAQHISGFGQRG
jgi:Protein of unknown function (DUF1569)